MNECSPTPLSASPAENPSTGLGRNLCTGLGAGVAASLAALALALVPQLATAQSALPTSMDDLVQVEILDGGLASDGSYIGALRLTLQQGWKTYWRAPGEAGIPPRFTWRGSRNVGEMSMTWPAPEVFSTSGYQTIGYHDQLVLPIRITPEKPGRPVRLKGRMELGICKDVCVPSELSFDHQLDSGATRNPAIVAALASRPYSAREAGVSASTCRLKPTQYGIEVEARITMPSAGGKEVAVIESGSPHVFAGATTTARSGKTLVAKSELLPARAGSLPAVDRSQLRITILGQNHAVDISGCTAG
ncbi:protein-disulfide reductase DsbD domain-containing protein [Phaeobacter sp. 11ANDIMAR09]|uniref:protein-disulfide reductase DsbD domain-containing protein n=1 Tax=Phaeobacter sp. 11ANDIMAR09 TaxID=1225647 RepID=UPI0009F8D7B8